MDILKKQQKQEQRLAKLNAKFLVKRAKKIKQYQEKITQYQDLIRTSDNEKIRRVSQNKIATINYHLDLLQKKDHLTQDDELDYKFKRWFFGVGKEFSRVSWPKKRAVINDFVIIIIIVFTIAMIFFAIDSWIVPLIKTNPAPAQDNPDQQTTTAILFWLKKWEN